MRRDPRGRDAAPGADPGTRWAEYLAGRSLRATRPRRLILEAVGRREGPFGAEALRLRMHLTAAGPAAPPGLPPLRHGAGDPGPRSRPRPPGRHPRGLLRPGGDLGPRAGSLLGLLLRRPPGGLGFYRQVVIQASLTPIFRIIRLTHSGGDPMVPPFSFIPLRTCSWVWGRRTHLAAHRWLGTGKGVASESPASGIDSTRNSPDHISAGRRAVRAGDPG
jgi:hypothetical protein